MRNNIPQAAPSVRTVQKARHRSRILELIRTSELISRTDLARRSGLSQSSVTGVTADLIREGLIEERKAGEIEGGRPPILLALRPAGVHVVGINLSNDQIRVAIIDFLADVKASHSVPLEKERYQPEELVEIIAAGVQACIWEAGFSKDQIAGVGVGIPGPVDSDEGIIRFLPNYGWENIAFRDMLSQSLNHPVFIDNSSNNLAIAEYWYGDGRGIDNFLVVTLETGVGSGTIINGELVRGHLGIASEFGHFCIDPEGEKCRCGRSGCIEAYVGNIAMIRYSKKLIEQGLWSDPTLAPDVLGFDAVLRELEHGNSHLEEFFQRAGRLLGQGIYNLTTLLNPELVIVTGKGVEAGETLFSPMFERFDALSQGRFGPDKIKIVINGWNDLEWARGAGTLVLREIYKAPTTN